jgi:hypothetical protein
MSATSTVGSPLELSAAVTADPSFLPAAPPQAAPIPVRRRLPASVACPSCHCTAIHRSRRRGLDDWIMSALGFLPARCFTCERRFYARQLPLKDQP